MFKGVQDCSNIRWIVYFNPSITIRIDLLKSITIISTIFAAVSMTTLVVGASGATGRLLVEQMLERGQHVRIIVRSTDSLPSEVISHKNLSVICASILDLSESEMAEHVGECDAIVSCLGHNLSFKGIFGKPRHILRCTKLGNQACRMPCGAAGQLFAFQQHNIFPAQFSKMIGDRAADGTAARADGRRRGRGTHPDRTLARDAVSNWSAPT